MMFQMKFGCNRPAGLGDIHVWKCGRMDTRTHGRTPARVLSFKPTLWAFSSGELKTTEKRWRHRFPHYKSMGAFCCHGNQSFDPICPKTLCSLSPTLMMLHIKFDQDWPTGLRDIQVSSELWQNHRMTQPQNAGRTMQIQYRPYFFKAGL